jgi:hypothetical protein
MHTIQQLQSNLEDLRSALPCGILPTPAGPGCWVEHGEEGVDFSALIPEAEQCWLQEGLRRGEEGFLTPKFAVTQAEHVAVYAVCS